MQELLALHLLQQSFPPAQECRKAVGPGETEASACRNAQPEAVSTGTACGAGVLIGLPLAVAGGAVVKSLPI
jgi:hypothetical protein